MCEVWDTPWGNDEFAKAAKKIADSVRELAASQKARRIALEYNEEGMDNETLLTWLINSRAKAANPKLRELVGDSGIGVYFLYKGKPEVGTYGTPVYIGKAQNGWEAVGRHLWRLQERIGTKTMQIHTAVRLGSEIYWRWVPLQSGSIAALAEHELIGSVLRNKPRWNQSGLIDVRQEYVDWMRIKIAQLQGDPEVTEEEQGVLSKANAMLGSVSGLLVEFGFRIEQCLTGDAYKLPEEVMNELQVPVDHYPKVRRVIENLEKKGILEKSKRGRRNVFRLVLSEAERVD